MKKIPAYTPATPHKCCGVTEPHDQITKSAGFTLIELLIVIVIISIVATFAVLSININQNKRLETLTNQLVNTLVLAQQEALLRPATLGLAISKNSFQFYRYNLQSDSKDKPWKPISDSLLGSRTLPNDIKMTLQIQGEEKSNSNALPKLLFSAGGDTTPFTIYIGKNKMNPRYKITGNRNGSIKSELIYAE